MDEPKQNFPLFPLEIIIFPGEIQPLHIFEPRYKQLIRDIELSDGQFGIPFVINGQICEIGSCVKLHRILSVTSTGEMDILVKGVSIIKIEKFYQKLSDKLYGGGTIRTYSEINTIPSEELMEHFRTYLDQLSRINKLSDQPQELPQNITILDLAGQLPLGTEEKYQFISYTCPVKRERFLIQKLQFLKMINQKLEEVGYRFYLN